jgi:nucleoid-associated protein YgaU
VNCRLLSVDIKYTLFDKSGNPLRAELDVIFLEDISDEQRAKLEDKKSPDIARTRLAVAGDALPTLCRKIYGSEQYYLKVAAYNRINHPREIAPGLEILFPPLDKLV